MITAVRYYSRSGNTRTLAEAIAKGAGCDAISVTAPDAQWKGTVDVLFIGGAQYAYGLDRHLKKYIQDLKPTKVKKAVVFSTTWLNRHSIEMLKKMLKDKGIAVEEHYLYAKNKPTPEYLEEARKFAEDYTKD